MNAITLKFLEAQVLRLNTVTGSPAKPYKPAAEGLTAQIGNYHLSSAYGGVALHRMENESGGISDVFRCGHVTKRELSGYISAMLVGIEAKEVSK